MKLAATGSSVIGPAHQQDNLPNQDAVMVHGIPGGWCIAVCDGLGSRALSHIGSRKAAQLVRTALRQQKPESMPSSSMHRSQTIQQSWLDEFAENSSPYETTCLWAQVCSNGYGKAAQVGDGLLLVKADGVLQIVTPPRDGFGNQTQTLAQAKAGDWITTEFQFSRPGDGVLLMTDGISDDLIPDQLEGFFDAVYLQLKCSNKRRCKRWLTKELEDWSTPKHGDDKSIAGIFRTK
jgi:serine/threonine protein phosphatase PrpC